MSWHRPGCLSSGPLSRASCCSRTPRRLTQSGELRKLTPIDSRPRGRHPRGQPGCRTVPTLRSFPMTTDPRALAFALTALALSAAPRPAAAADPLVFVTAFAPGERGGIHAYEFSTRDGQLKPLRRTAGAENPFFLALSPDRKFLYSIHAKQFGGKENEQVAAYAVLGRTGELKLLNRQSAQGTAACYLDVDKSGKAVLVANYASGSVAALPVRADGALGEPASFFPH